MSRVITPLEEATERSEKRKMAKSHILVVEDDKSLAEVLAYNLSQAGYEVSVARDGKDGLQQAEVKVPDLILLDLMLPEWMG